MIRSCGIDKPKWRQNCFIGNFKKSAETNTIGFEKAFGTYWYFEQTITSMSGIEKYLTTWAKTIQLYIVNLFYTILSENDIHWSLLWFYWKILQQIEALSQCPKCSFHQKWGCLYHFVILTFFIVFANITACIFCIIYVCNNLRWLCKAYWHLMPFSLDKLQWVQS